MRQIIQKTKAPYVCKPVLIGLFGGCKELHRNIMQDIVREAANHAEEGELLEMEQSFAR